MLVRFSCVATGSVLMFGDIAVSLIKMMGATGKVPGAINAEGVSTALTRLRKQLELVAEADDGAQGTTASENEEDEEALIPLAVRAAPLIQILERAADAGKAVMWEKK